MSLRRRHTEIANYPPRQDGRRGTLAMFVELRCANTLVKTAQRTLVIRTLTMFCNAYFQGCLQSLQMI